MKKLSELSKAKTTDELAKHFATLLHTPLAVHGVITCNYTLGHPFTIGPSHVAHAADHCHGMLGTETLEAIPCAAPKCRQAHSAHRYDTVLVLKLLRSASETEVKAQLTKDFGAQMEASGLDGLVFLQQDDCRITKEEEVTA